MVIASRRGSEHGLPESRIPDRAQTMASHITLSSLSLFRIHPSPQATLSSMTAHPASAFLVSLLSSPSASLTLAPQRAQRPSCAFYDEPLPLVLTLRLAPNALPAPKDAATAQHPLPLPTLQPGLTLDDEEEEEEDESPLTLRAPAAKRARVPTALHLLLAHTRATAEAAYVSPGGASGGAAMQAPSFWRAEWAGNHTPRAALEKDEGNMQGEKGRIWYEVKEARWCAEWNVRAPIGEYVA